MYRNAAARSALRAFSSSNASVARSALGNQICKAQMTSSARNLLRPSVSPSFALAAHKPVTTALVRYSSSSAKVREGTWLVICAKGTQWLIADTIAR